MIRRPPRSTLDRSSAASDVYKRQAPAQAAGGRAAEMATGDFRPVCDAMWHGLVVADDSGMIPVSYTHLRAHETVLDLVCRLLLEKKKRILQNTRNTEQKRQ